MPKSYLHPFHQRYGRDHQNDETAFSILEILIALLIVAILAVLLGGAYGKIRYLNQQTQCLSNLRSIGALLLIQARENRGQLDHLYGGTFGQGGTISSRARHWTTQLRSNRYLTDEKLMAMTCQRAEISTKTSSGSHYGLNMADPYGAIIYDDSGGSGGLYTLNIATHPEPARSILIADSCNSEGYQWTRIFQKAQVASGAVHTRHNNLANIVFLDGHAETANHARLEDLGMPGFFSEQGDLIKFPKK